MKRYYANRIILGAMCAFLIVMVVAVAGIGLFSYQQMESETDAFLQGRLEENNGRDGKDGKERGPKLPAMFGYDPGQRRFPSAFWDIRLTADGQITQIHQLGITDEGEDTVREMALQMASSP
ncbi:MAG: hypothetical protein Q4C54_06600 [Clostridia bacterium]|nr:hypothetical protein [Clostridia bacterium]